MSDEYAFVNKSKLRLNNDNAIKKKSKKKKDNSKLCETLSKVSDAKLAEELARLAEKQPSGAKQIIEEIKDKDLVRPEPTKAEIAFKNMQEKRQMDRILKKASKSHKQRVEEFNNHLDSLSEHYDIPKVSWTK